MKSLVSALINPKTKRFHRGTIARLAEILDTDYNRVRSCLRESLLPLKPSAKCAELREQINAVVLGKVDLKSKKPGPKSAKDAR